MNNFKVLIHSFMTIIDQEVTIANKNNKKQKQEKLNVFEVTNKSTVWCGAGSNVCCGGSCARCDSCGVVGMKRLTMGASL